MDLLIGHLIIWAFVLALAGGAISALFAAYYLVMSLRRFHPERGWGRFIGVSFFVPWFFTVEGNAYRVKLLRSGGFVALFTMMGAGVSFGIKALAT